MEMSEEKTVAKPAESEPSLAVKIVAIIIGTAGAAIAVYLGFWLFDYVKTELFGGTALPPDSALPVPLKGINPVIWEEAKRMTKATP